LQNDEGFANRCGGRSPVGGPPIANTSRSDGRTLLVVPAHSLILARQSQNQTVALGPPDDLQSYWKPTLVESARNADRRQPIVIGEHGVFSRESQRIFHRVLDSR